MSTLFGNSGMFGSNSIFSGNSSVLSDWANIRSGSYKKLMKAYYAKTKETSDTDSSSKKKTEADKKTLTAAESSAQGLKKAADALLATGNKSVFKKVDTKDADGNVTQEYNTDKIYNAVNKFVQNYNDVLSSTEKTINSGVSNNKASMISATEAKESFLNQIGITIKSDNSLEIDKEAFQKADMSKVEALFSGNSSYGYQTSLRAALIDYHAGREADTYNRFGNYNSYNSGTNFNSWF